MVREFDGPEQWLVQLSNSARLRSSEPWLPPTFYTFQSEDVVVEDPVPAPTVRRRRSCRDEIDSNRCPSTGDGRVSVGNESAC